MPSLADRFRLPSTELARRNPAALDLLPREDEPAFSFEPLPSEVRTGPPAPPTGRNLGADQAAFMGVLGKAIQAPFSIAGGMLEGLPPTVALERGRAPSDVLAEALAGEPRPGETRGRTLGREAARTAGQVGEMLLPVPGGVLAHGAAQEAGTLARGAARSTPLAALAPKIPTTPATRAARVLGIRESGPVVEQQFRMDKLNLPPEAEASVQRTISALGLERRRVRTFGDMQAAAHELGINIDDLANTAIRKPLTDSEVVATRSFLSQQARLATDAERAAARAGITTKSKERLLAQAGEAQTRMEQALKRLIKGGTEAGRAVAAYRIQAQESLDPSFWLMRAERVLTDSGRPLTTEIRSDIMDAINTQNRVALATIMASLRKPHWTEKALALWKVGLLSNPATHARNLTGNVGIGLFETLKDVPAGVMDWGWSIATGAERSKLVPSRLALAERFRGFGEGLKEAGEFVKTGIRRDLIGKYDFNRSINFDNPFLQFYTQAVFRTLGAEDVLFRQPALRGTIAELAQLQAAKEGLKGQKYLARVRDLIKKPDQTLGKTGETLLDIGQSAADYATFQRPTGIGNFRPGRVGAMRAGVELVAPFRRTPVNIAKTIIDYSPFGLPKAAIEWSVNKSKGVDPLLRRRYLVEDLGRSLTGSTLAGLGWYLRRQGMAVGNTPENKQQRDLRYSLGIPANAVMVNGRWVEIQGTAPIGNMLLLGVNAAEHFATQDPLQEKLLGASGEMLKTLSEQTFLRGVSAAVEAAQNPGEKLPSFAQTVSGSVVPAIVGAIARGTDPLKRRQKGLGLAGPVSRIPGARQTLEPVIDSGTGEDVPETTGVAGQLFSPARTRPVQPSARFALANGEPTRLDGDAPTLARHAYALAGWAPGRPTQTLERRGERVRLSDNEYTEFQRDMGKAASEAVARIVNSSRFQRASRDDREELARDAVQERQRFVRNRWKRRTDLKWEKRP